MQNRQLLHPCPWYGGEAYSGGLAILCKQAAPQQRMEEGTHVLGSWALGSLSPALWRRPPHLQCVWLSFL
eukprot:5699969-Amphidinium_carterae.2